MTLRPPAPTPAERLGRCVHCTTEIRQVLLAAGPREIWMPITCERCGADAGVSSVMPPDPEQLERDRRLRLLGIPHGFELATFATWDDRKPAAKRVRAIGDRFLEIFGNPPASALVLVFDGAPGTGKTHFAVALAVHLALVGGVTARYARFPEVLAEIRAGTAADAEPSDRELAVLERLRGVGFLVLDMLQESAVQWDDKSHASLLEIVGPRYESRRPTVLITNDDGGDIVEGLLVPAGKITPSRIPFGSEPYSHEGTA